MKYAVIIYNEKKTHQFDRIATQPHRCVATDSDRVLAKPRGLYTSDAVLVHACENHDGSTDVDRGAATFPAFHASSATAAFAAAARAAATAAAAAAAVAR